MRYVLEFKEVDSVDFSGLGYYVDHVSQFELSDFCEFNKINPYDVDHQSIKAVDNAQSRLNDGQYLIINYETYEY